MFCTLPGAEFAACTHPFGSAQKLDEHYRVKDHGQLDTTPQVAQNTTLCVHTPVLVR